MHLRQSLIQILTWGKLWLPLFLCLEALAVDTAHLPEWLNLLHFKGQRSLLDSPQFFLDQGGVSDPEAELKASLAAVSGTKTYGRLKLPFACAYPARMKFLSKHYQVTSNDKCAELEDWLKGLNPESISLIFASYYPNNPASIFGHTFLKINTSAENKISDYAVNYLAITSETNGLMFGLKGLFGMYRGQFSIMPYFLKVNEYNHSESRDLFEYPLTLTKDEIDTLLRHVWELENNGFFDYYFVDDNCSYFLMRILDVARPELKLSKKFPLEVIPAETVKAVNKSGLSLPPIYRPSLYTQLDRLMKIQPHDIDTRIMLKQFKKLAQKKWGPDDEYDYHKLLTQRSKETSIKEVTKFSPDAYPHETHSPKTISLGSGIIEDRAFSRLSFRFGIHNLLDPEAGYLPFSGVDFLNVSFRSFKSRQIYLDQFTLIDIVTLNPNKSWNPKLSWKTKIEYKRFDQDLCAGCKVNRLYSALGKSYVLSDHNILSFFIDAQFLLTDSLEKSFSYGLNPEITYHFSSNKINLESAIVLINRFEKTRTLDSLKLSQGASMNLDGEQSLRLKVQYYAPVSQDQNNRYESVLEWTKFL
jgi:hypothetical protein